MSRRKKNKIISEMNVVPYIDVMLVLLIIFMVTAPMITQGVKVDLPNSQNQEVDMDGKDPMVISVNVKGEYYMDTNDTESFSLEKIIESYNKRKLEEGKLKVFIRGDEHVGYGKIIKLMSDLKHNGVGDVGLITEDPSN